MRNPAAGNRSQQTIQLGSHQADWVFDCSSDNTNCCCYAAQHSTDTLWYINVYCKIL